MTALNFFAIGEFWRDSLAKGIWKIKIAGLLNIELKSTHIPGFDHVNQTVNELEERIKSEAQKNKKLEQMFSSMQKQI